MFVASRNIVVPEPILEHMAASHAAEATCKRNFPRIKSLSCTSHALFMLFMLSVLMLFMRTLQGLAKHGKRTTQRPIQTLSGTEVLKQI